jgi:cytoskeletal protein RodZ
MKRTKSKKIFRSTRSRILLLLVIILLLGAGAWAAGRNNNDKKTANNPSSSSSSGQSPNGASPDLNPATSQDQQYSDSHKDEIAQQQSSPGSAQGNDSGKSAVITSATGSAIRALVSGVVEDGGTCTFVFTQGTQTITKTTQGVGNVSSTNCVLYDPAPSTYLGSGTWKVALSYTSSTTSVKSGSTEVK